MTKIYYSQQSEEIDELFFTILFPFTLMQMNFSDNIFRFFRQFDGLKSGCLQFLTRCFPSWESNDSKTKENRQFYRHINKIQLRCKCCLNQPDEYCHQLECEGMKPSLGASTNTSCLCYAQSNYPNFICNKKKAIKKDQARLLDALMANEEKKSWPYEKNVAFIQEINLNLKRRIQESSQPTNPEKISVLIPKQQSETNLSGFWISENVVVLPILVATCVVLLGLVAFGCFLIIVAKMQTKNEQHPPVVNANQYENNFSPKTSAIILQNKASSPKSRLINQKVKFAPLPRNRELCELDYFKPCNCKRPMVTVQL